MSDELVVKTYYLQCLAQASYVVAHGGNAFVIDPRRDVDHILAEVAALGCRLKGVLETHVHADFVSGHSELADRARCPVIVGAHAGMTMPHYGAEDGDRFNLSERYAVVAMHTPGHTPGCVTWLVVDKQQEDLPVKAFTGDFLFVGSVGRPDLLGALGHTKEEMASTMFDTLHSKLPLLPDACEVLPGHGPGSPCGAGFGADLSSTVGKERLTNPALQIHDRAAFVEFLIGSQSEAPAYFLNVVGLNRTGATSVGEQLAAVPRMGAEEFAQARESRHVSGDDIVVLDVRHASDFCQGHIQGALNFPLGADDGVTLGAEDGNMGIWIGTLISTESKLLVVAPDGQNDDAVRRLARVGFHNVAGVLEGGFAAWRAAGLEVTDNDRLVIEGEAQLRALLASGVRVVDVRTPTEFACPSLGRVEGSVNAELAQISAIADAGELLARDGRYVTVCRGGFRSTIARSMLLRAGYDVVGDIDGGLYRVKEAAPGVLENLAAA